MLSDVLVAILPIQNVGDFVFARVLSLFVCRSGHLDKSLLLVYISHLVEWLVPEGSLLEVPSWSYVVGFPSPNRKVFFTFLFIVKAI